jgi:DeoR family glycerol-3-phosphate regulon repressor
MKPQDRRSQIVAAIRGGGEVSVETLARRFAVSLETVRRDLAKLAERGLVDKVHGGARPPRLAVEGSLAERIGENAEAKRTIAQKLAGLVASGETLFIDTGSTTLACAEALSTHDGLTVITNSLGVARVMGEGARVFVLGGEYAAGNAQTVGPLAIAQAASFQADRAVITVSALDAEAGAMDASLEEASVARAMIEGARQLVVVADSTKFARSAGFRVCPLSEIDVLVSESAPPPALMAAMKAAAVHLA